MPVSRNILSASFDGSTLLKPRSHDFNVQGTDLIHGAGADLYASLIEKLTKFFQVTVGFDDAISISALTAKIDTTGTLVVNDLDAGSATVGRTFTWTNARLMDVTLAQRFAIAGEYAIVCFVPAFDGATNPLVVT